MNGANDNKRQRQQTMHGHDVLQYSLINSMRTGNMMIDAIMTLIMTAVLTAIMQRFRHFSLYSTLRRISELWKRNVVYTKIITFEHQRWGHSMNHLMNDETCMLQKIIIFYVNHCYAGKFIRTDCKFILEDSEKSKCKIDDMYVLSTPQFNYFENLTPTMRFMIKTETIEHGNGQHSEIKTAKILEFKSTVKGEIDAFINDAIIWYKSSVLKIEEDKRYIYLLHENSSSSNVIKITNDDDECGPGPGPRRNKPQSKKNKSLTFNRYVLYSNKSPESIFFPNKREVLAQIDDFQKGTGKYSLPDFPKQMHMLLAGPPGTGKSSFIKMMSQHTGRHIVYIDLCKIKTDQDIRSIIYDRKYDGGDDGFDKYDSKDIIFVFEDIDRMNSDIIFDDDYNKVDSVKKNAENSPQIVFLKEKEEEKKTDTVTLSCLLNILDGVIECPQRMIIITTNHPEKLHPVLFRPGRINMKIYLDYIHSDQALEMLRKFFPNYHMTKAQMSLLIKVIDGKKVAPSLLEGLCIEHNTIDDLLEALETLKVD